MELLKYQLLIFQSMVITVHFTFKTTPLTVEEPNPLITNFKAHYRTLHSKNLAKKEIIDLEVRKQCFLCN